MWLGLFCTVATKTDLLEWQRNFTYMLQETLGYSECMQTVPNGQKNTCVNFSKHFHRTFKYIFAWQNNLAERLSSVQFVRLLYTFQACAG